MKFFLSVISSLFLFCAISASHLGRQMSLVNPTSVEVMPVKEVEKKLKALESHSDIYKEYAKLQGSVDCTHNELQAKQKEFKSKILEPDQVEYYHSDMSDINARLFKQSLDLTRFESSECSRLLDRANMYATYWRSKYEELKESVEQLRLGIK